MSGGNTMKKKKETIEELIEEIEILSSIIKKLNKEIKGKKEG